MDKEKLSQLGIWEYYKYSELCALLGEPEKQGNSKKAQEKEWARYFEFEKIGETKGVRYIIDDIYDVEKRKAPVGNSKYAKLIEALLSSAIIDYCEKENTNEVKIVTDWKSIAHTLYIFNDNVLIGNSYLGSEAKNRYDISGQTFDAFIHADGRFVKTKIECALNNMAKNEEITWRVIRVGLIDNKYHELSEQECTRYFEIRDDLIREYMPDCKDVGKGMWKIIDQSRQSSFYAELNELTKEKMGISKIFPKYEIQTREKLMMYAAERLTGLKYGEAALKLNEEIYNGLRASRAMLCYKRIKARDLADGGYIIINEENLVSPKERDHLVGLVHGLEGGEILELMGDTDELTYGIDAIEYRKFKNEAPRSEMKITA